MPFRIALSLMVIPIVIKTFDIQVDKKVEHVPEIVEEAEKIVG